MMIIAALVIIAALIGGLGLAISIDRQPSEPEYELDYEPEPEPEPEDSPRSESPALTAMLEPLRQYTKPGKGPLEVFGWTVRKHDDSWAVVPFDSKGVLLWSRAPYTDLADPRLAWDLANTGRRALKWIDG